MENSQSEKTSNNAMDIEQNDASLKEGDSTSSDSKVDDGKENGADLFERSGKKVDIAIPNENETLKIVETDEIVLEKATTVRDTVEILNVELVVPGRVDFADVDNSKPEQENIDNFVKDKSSPISGVDAAANLAQSQVQDEITCESKEMDTNDHNIHSSQEKENNNVTNSLRNTDRNDSESLDSATTSGLGLLSQYQSDDDSDSVVEVPILPSQDYRNQVVEVDSGSDSDDSSASSDVEYLNELRKTIEKRIEVVDEDDGDDEDNDANNSKKRHQQKLRIKGELFIEDLPPIQDLQITVPEDDCIELGKIHSIVDQLVLVNVLPNSILLDLGTVMFLEKGQKVLGEVFDVLGQVADPLYCVRFNSNQQIKEKQINIGDIVYVAPKTQYTQYVILSSLMKTKGSDASWENDMEPPPKFLDYSDDEQEQLAKRQLRKKDRTVDNEDPSKKPRTLDGDDSMTNASSSSNTYRNRYDQRNNRGGQAGHQHTNNRPRFNGPHQNMQRPPNHHRTSWHSNYYPQSFTPQTPNYGMHPAQNQPQSPRPYSPHMPAYAMPPVHNMPYRPPQAAPYAAPPIFQQQPQQLSQNTFSIRAPTFHGHPPHVTHNYQYTSPPPPPGSQ